MLLLSPDAIVYFRFWVRGSQVIRSASSWSLVCAPAAVVLFAANSASAYVIDFTPLGESPFRLSEPSTLLLLGAGLVLAARHARRVQPQA
jgi:hypothetical protein